MGVFEIVFIFEGRRCLATVSTINKRDHLQYTIIPQDDDIQELYPAQVIREAPGKGLEPAFAPKTDEAREYADAILAGLSKFLDRPK
ncbi:MAG: hypothetical protein Q8927_10785 [Bacteroidota bacterium]|nr:hypothetical protein [Bacteroidota bacterium]MDP4216678.1 hypothetical protein [Bacteroidota bacterium]MDP4244218.1 hypothetical protein [Bacteroidota bacterium]MDP4253410.1 hypothetical protein [Bacteroidota bacterium]MDP4258878.1 hypothetical protein [Bacteroidota bacterium]